MSAENTIRAFLFKKITRREFTKRLRDIGVTAGAAYAFAETLSTTNWAIAADGTVQMPRALKPQEFKVVQAIAGRIMPATDTPGAIEAGSADYIDIALANPYKSQLAHYQRALAELEKHCGAALGKSFTVLDEHQQDDVLEQLDAGKIAEVNDGKQFFELIRRHVLEGFFCEPHYGGNKDMIGWKLVGFPGQQYGYPDPYINKKIDLPPVAFDGPPQKRV
jgi:gluconate 2-dehydrogenase gamma chain